MEEEENLEGNNEEPEIEIDDKQIRRLKNLKMFKDKTDDEVREYIRNRPRKPPPIKQTFIDQLPVPKDEAPEIKYDEAEYQRKYRNYMKKYLKEYGVDMNDANDAQALESLVRFIIQNEVVDATIRQMQSMKHFDTRSLKNLGDFQRANSTSISELQDKLGISRKIRKDKQADDLGEYIRGLNAKALTYWQRVTVPVICQKCQIELARYWLNFPDQVEEVNFTIECDKCHEKVVYAL